MQVSFGGRRSSNGNSFSKDTLLSSVGMDICSRGSICGKVFPVVSFNCRHNCRIEWMMHLTKLHVSVNLSRIITFPGTLAGMMKEGKTPGFIALNCRQGSPITIVWWKKLYGCYSRNLGLYCCNLGCIRRMGWGDVKFFFFPPSFPWWWCWCYHSCANERRLQMSKLFITFASVILTFVN